MSTGCVPCGSRRSRVEQAAARSAARGDPPQSIVSAAPGPYVMWEVKRNGVSTGRKFTSPVSASAYAARVGGEVHPL